MSQRDEDGRKAALRGVMFVALRMGDVLERVSGELPNHLRLCLFDGDGAEPRNVLAGTLGCANPVAAGDLEQANRIDFAGRRWALRVAADPARMPGGNQQSARLFAVIGLVAAALLGALLLTVTGRTRRVERAVRERTLALEQQIDVRARTEAALRESEQRLRSILDHAPIGVIYTDLHGHTQDSNPRFRDLTGYSAEELASMVALELTHPDDRAADIELAGKLARGEVPMYRRRKRYVRKDGGIVWVQAIVSLVRGTDGRPHRIVGMVEDISEHLKLQQAEDARASARNRQSREERVPVAHEP